MNKNRSHSLMEGLAACILSRSSLASLSLVALLFLILPQAARAQATPCPDPPASMSGPHTFHSLGEALILPLNLAPCHTVTVDISWSNGLNNGSNLKISFLDSSGQTIYSESDISAYLSGSRSFPSSPPWPYPWRGSRSALFNPANVKIETISPFADPCGITYTVTFASRPGYNIGGDSFANAPVASPFPATYLGSMYDGRNPFEGGTSIDPGQYIKVHLKCKQAIYVYGSVTVHNTVSRNFEVDIYDASQQP